MSPVDARAAAAWRNARTPSRDEPPCVRRIDPGDGAVGVFRDTPVLVTLSCPADPESVAGSFWIEEASQAIVPGRVDMSPDGSVLIWTAARLYLSSTAHVVTVSGLRDRKGRPLPLHRSRFTTSDLALRDLLG